MRRNADHAGFIDLGKLVVGCAAFAALISATGVRAAEEVASNIDLMQKLTVGVIEELHGKFSPSVTGRAVRLKPAGSTEDYVFVTNVFREELTRLGVETLEPLTPLTVSSPAPATPNTAGTGQSTNPAVNATGNTVGNSTTSPTWSGTPGVGASEPVETPGQPALILQYQNVVFDLKYVDSHRSYVVGGKRVDNSSTRAPTSTRSERSATGCTASSRAWPPTPRATDASASRHAPEAG